MQKKTVGGPLRLLFSIPKNDLRLKVRLMKSLVAYERNEKKFSNYLAN